MRVSGNAAGERWTSNMGLMPMGVTDEVEKLDAERDAWFRGIRTRWMPIGS